MPPANPLRISQNVSEEITRLEAEIAALQLKLTGPAPQFNPRKWQHSVNSQLADKEARLRILKEPGADPPGITPAPGRGPTFSTADPAFAGVNLDVGRIGVDALKLISYSSQAR